ncbi:MAG: DUF4012 domain-containing protein [Candidatus Falkowbacteria bacterium]
MFNRDKKSDHNLDNDFQKIGLSPNFLDGLDGFEFYSAQKRKIKKEWRQKIVIIKKKVKNQERVIVKPIYTLEKVIWKTLQNQHYKFDRLLADGEKKLKKVRRQKFLGQPKKPIIMADFWQFSWYRSLFSFFLVLLLLVIPFKIIASLQVFNLTSLEKKIMLSSKSAISDLSSAGDAASKFDLFSAQNHFASAGADFLQASEDMSFINDTLLSLASLSSDPKLKLAAESKKFLRIGILGSSLGSEMSQALSGLNNNQNSDWIKVLDDFSIHSHLALTDATDLKMELQKINIDNLPAEYQDKFKELSAKVEKLPENLSLVVDNIDELKTFLGAGRDKRYLLVFQNNAEMRGSGGFLGSYALVDFREGKIRNLEVPGGGSYDTEAGLTEKIKAPAPLWLVNPQWHFWDANWWPDWPTTAKNLMWFYEKSDGPSVDGVISFTPSVIEKLLVITGPIDMTKDYGLVITADNFWQQVELTAERDNLTKSNPEAVSHLPQGEKNKPKKIIGDLMSKILEILPKKLDKDNLIKLLNISEDSLASKQIMFYFKDAKLEKNVADHNWGGVMTDSPLDYLMVVNTNIAGAKTDRVIKESINHQVTVSSDGSIIDTVLITRTHTAAKNTPLVGVRNVDWLRVYVPQGSELLSASGFVSPDLKYFESPDPSWINNEFLSQTEDLATVDKNSGTKIYQENGKTVFANWLMLDPGSSMTVALRYKLPFNLWKKEKKNDFLSRLNDFLNPLSQNIYPYLLSVQKQPGAENETFRTNLNLPPSASIVWNSDDKYLNSLSLGLPLTRDNFYSALVSNK